MRESVTESDGTEIIWDYDNLNHLIYEDYNAPGTSDDYTHEYVYDLIGNRLERVVYDGPNTTYTYDPNNDRLLEETTDGNTIYYSYDDNGSLTQKDDGTVTAYTYDLQNRLDSVTVGANPTVTYKYNPDGIRIEKKVGSDNPIKYLVDPFNHTDYTQVFKEIQTGSDDVAYIMGHDVLAQAVGSIDPNYCIYDGHGSVVQLADPSGIVTENYYYDAYGKLLPSSDTPSTNLLYAGEIWDNNLQQYYLRARWYDPATGRFNRMDPFVGNTQDPQSLHKYLYCHANPINNVDPSGLYNLLFARIGQIVHRELATMYRIEHPGHYVEANYYAIPGTIPALKPDIMDFSSKPKQIAEIKPLNSREIAKGIAKLVGYLGAANTLGLYGGGWCTSTWQVGIRVVPIPGYPNWSAVTVGNWKGLILYKRFEMPSEKLKMALTAALAASLVKQLESLAEGLGDAARDRAEALDGLVYALSQQLDTAVALGTAQNMARMVGPAVAVGLAAHIGMRLTLAPMTVRYGL